MSNTGNDGVVVDETMTLTVLAANTILQVDLARTDDLRRIYKAVKAEGYASVNALFGNCPIGEVTFYRLQPAPSWEAFTYLEDERTVADADFVLDGIEKVALGTMRRAAALFGNHPDEECVSLYIKRNTVEADSIQTAIDASKEMQLAVYELGLTDDLFVVLGNPFVALVNSRVEAGRQYFLKLLRSGRTGEVSILSYLAGIDSPNNHAVRPITSRVWERNTLLLLPNAGVPVLDYEDRQVHLVSVAIQFLLGVAFLHEHKVAHCDLKPSNVVVDRETGRVTLIDFDLAVRGLDWLEGFSGTDGWTAPEVGVVARYNPFQADVWSAGKVLRTVCWECPVSSECQALLDLSERMMADSPDARPSMKTVVESLDPRVRTCAEPKIASEAAASCGSHLMPSPLQPLASA